MKGICALHQVEEELKESHIYPKFVINHTKNTGSKYFRRIADPNKRQQDGIKLYLLCNDAEQAFSKKEKWFAENIFVPYLGGKYELPYNDNLYYFAISFLWRILVLNFKTDNSLSKKWYYDVIVDAEKQWRNYLTTGTLPSNEFKTCILFMDTVSKNNSGLKGVDFYLTRALDATIVDNEPQTCLLIYGKFNRFIFWSVLKNYGDEDNLKSVEINPNGGVMRIPQRIDYFPILSFLGNRIKEISELPLPNQDQQNKIEQEILKDPKAFWESDVGRSLYNDNFNLNQ